MTQIEEGVSEEISEVGQNGKAEETASQPQQSSSEHTEVLEYPQMQCFKEESCSNQAYY